MKMSKSQLIKLIKEEIRIIVEDGGMVSNIGGRSGEVGALGRASQERPVPDADSETQARALNFFMDLGLDDKVSAVLAHNIAIPDLEIVMDAIPKIDTAAEEDFEV